MLLYLIKQGSLVWACCIRLRPWKRVNFWSILVSHFSLPLCYQISFRVLFFSDRRFRLSRICLSHNGEDFFYFYRVIFILSLFRCLEILRVEYFILRLWFCWGLFKYFGILSLWLLFGVRKWLLFYFWIFCFVKFLLLLENFWPWRNHLSFLRKTRKIVMLCGTLNLNRVNILPFWSVYLLREHFFGEIGRKLSLLMKRGLIFMILFNKLFCLSTQQLEALLDLRNKSLLIHK